MKNFRQYMKWSIILFQVIFDGIGMLCLSYIPVIEKNLIDHGIQNGMVYVLYLIGWMCGLHLVYVIVQYFCMVLGFQSGIYFEQKMKYHLFHHLMDWSYQKFQQSTKGEYLSLIQNDVLALEQDGLQPFVDAIRSIVSILVYGVILFVVIDFRLAILIIGLSILTICIPKWIARPLEQKRKIYQQKLGTYTTLLDDLLSSFSLKDKVAKQKLDEKHELELFKMGKLRLAYGKQKSLNLSISLFFTKLIRICTFGLAGYLYLKSQITIGTMVASFSYMYSFLDPIDNLLYDYTTMHSLDSIQHKILDIFAIVPILKQDIVFQDRIVIQHGFVKVGDFCLEDINLEILKNEKVVIYGDSGCGKSTLLKVIAGWLPLEKGSIQINGWILKRQMLKN